MTPPAAEVGPIDKDTVEREDVQTGPVGDPAANLANQLEPNDLALFARIVSAGSFSKASEQIGQPRSTISRRLAALERTMQQRLLVRSTRRIGLTDFGRAMLNHATRVAEAAAAATQLAESRHEEPNGALRIRLPTFLTQAASLLVARYLAQHPRVTLEIDLSPRRNDPFADGFDLVVRAGQFEQDDRTVVTQLAQLPRYLYASPGYLSRVGTPHEPADLANHDALMPVREAPGIWELVHRERPNQCCYAAPTARCTATSDELLALLAVDGRGIVGLPALVAETPPMTSLLVRVLPDWQLPAIGIWASVSAGEMLPIKTQLFLDALRAFLLS